MKKKYLFISILMFALMSCSNGQKLTVKTLKDAYKDKFLIGTALNQKQYTGQDTKSVDAIKQHFNSIVAENCMKSEKMQPTEGQFFFENADQFVEFGLKNNMHMVGHTLIWHSQLPSWFFVDESGKDVSREVLTERMRKHINTIVTRYKGKVKGWDVVNEAILDDGSFRQSKFYQILGEDYIRLAFEFAHKADPEAELYYNDYSMALPGKRMGTVNMVKKLQQQGVKIDAIGMQGHMSMDFPTVEEFEKSIIAFAELGVKVMITEMDISVLPFPSPDVGADIANTAEYKQSLNPYANGLPAEIYEQWHQRFAEFFRLFVKHQDKISRVTVWGLSDAHSWKNDWPVKGRTDYPLLFDRNVEPKPLVETLIKEVSVVKNKEMVANIK